MRWDIFCAVVDNFGDIGMCWRLARQLAARGHSVRLWVDDAAALEWMAPQGCPGVRVLRGLDPAVAEPGVPYEPGDIVLSAFATSLVPGVGAAMASSNDLAAAGKGVAARWIFLEYLSAESYVERSHGLESPVGDGPAKGTRRWFFFPGFTAASGGLLREPGLIERRTRFDRGTWLACNGIPWSGERIVSLFCYEPAGIAGWLQKHARAPTTLIVTPGRATAAVRDALAGLPASWNREANLRLHFAPALAQDEFDHLLWSCDWNFVRGEDSLVRALWAGAPFVWQAYPQSDGAHHAKLAAFLDWLRAPDALRSYHEFWNAAAPASVPEEALADWRTVVEDARARLLEQEDLVGRLLRFVAESR